MVKFPYLSPIPVRITHIEEVIRVLADQEPQVTLVKDLNKRIWFIQCDSHSVFWRLDFVRELIRGIDLGITEARRDSTNRSGRPEARVIQS